MKAKREKGRQKGIQGGRERKEGTEREKEAQRVKGRHRKRKGGR